MRKRGFLVIGILMVIAIMILQRKEMLLQMKKFALRVTQLIESSAMIVYDNIRTFVIVDV